MNFLFRLIKKKFNIHYVGQLRYIECIDLHKSFIADASSVYITVDTLIREVFNRQYTARHSINDLTIEDIRNKISDIKWINDAQLLTDSDYSEIENRHSVEFFSCNYFFTLSKSLSSQNLNDYAVLITTDLVFSPEINPIKKIINQIDHTETPTVYGMYLVENNQKLIITRLIIVNKAAAELIRINWKDALLNYFNEDHEYKLRNEYSTFRLFQLCGINQFLKLNAGGDIIRFRSNMVLHDLDTKNLLKQQSEFSNMKRQFVEDIRNGKYKNK